MTNQLGGRHVRDAHDLYQVWHELLLIDGVHGRSLWLIFFDADDRLLPAVFPSTEMPIAPDPKIVPLLRSVADGLHDSGVHSIALMISRPGSPHMSALDRDWARLLDRIDSGRRWPIHLATPDRLQVFALDDLLVA